MRRPLQLRAIISQLHPVYIRKGGNAIKQHIMNMGTNALNSCNQQIAHNKITYMHDYLRQQLCGQVEPKLKDACATRTPLQLIRSLPRIPAAQKSGQNYP